MNKYLYQRDITIFKVQKADAKKTAKQLCYGDKVIEEIDKAENIEEITRIMKSARERM